MKFWVTLVSIINDCFLPSLFSFLNTPLWLIIRNRDTRHRWELVINTSFYIPAQNTHIHQNNVSREKTCFKMPHSTLSWFLCCIFHNCIDLTFPSSHKHTAHKICIYSGCSQIYQIPIYISLGDIKFVNWKSAKMSRISCFLEDYWKSVWRMQRFTRFPSQAKSPRPRTAHGLDIVPGPEPWWWCELYTPC